MPPTLYLIYMLSANCPPPGTKKCAKPLPLGQNNHAKTPTLGQIFSQIQRKQQKFKTEIVKNSKLLEYKF